jgi:uncharacterized protein (TIGR03067 family)
MRRSAPLAVVASLLLVAAAMPQGAAPLQGEWRLASTADEKQNDPGCDESRMVVQADGAVAFALAGRKLNSGIFTFSKSGKLLTLDLKLADGRTLLGVYEQKGDELVICFAEADKGRPASTSPKGNQWAETWKRVKMRPDAEE